MRGWTMVLSATAGLFGAAGVALAAAGAHRAGPLATTAAYFLLFHAAALTAFCAIARPTADPALKVAASLIAIGALLFSGELAAHALADIQPLPLAAPTGGLLTIVGWLIAAIALPLSLRQRD